ncbi:MAG TPA: hypothetical protein VMW70_01485 [Burkholderiales bacterium]|nr:hypothetical protein [Burkholderiales bacterium]
MPQTFIAVIQDLADARNGTCIAPMHDWRPIRQTLSLVGYESQLDRSDGGTEWKNDNVAQYRMERICRVAATPPSTIPGLVERGQGAPSTIIAPSKNKRADANTFARPRPRIVVFALESENFFAMRRKCGRSVIPLIVSLAVESVSVSTFRRRINAVCKHSSIQHKNSGRSNQ